MPLLPCSHPPCLLVVCRGHFAPRFCVRPSGRLLNAELPSIWGGRCGSLRDIWLAEWMRAVDFPLQSTREEGLSSLVEVVVEVPKWSFVKRSQNGIIDFVSPTPFLFNYGSVPSIPAPDGDPLDAIILGKRLPLGHQGIVRVKGIIKFTDAGLVDNKLICTQRKPGNCSGDSGPEISEDLSVFDLLVLHSIFSAYAVAKSWLNIVQGKQNGPTSYGGYELYK